MPKVGLLLFHGMGKPSEDFASELLNNLSAEVKQDLVIKPIHYSPIMQPNQNIAWGALEPGLDNRKLRRFFLYSFSDAACLHYSGQNNTTVGYVQIQQLIRKNLQEMEKEGVKVIAVIAQSLGAQVLSCYLYDAAHGKGDFAKFPAKEFEKINNLKYLVTTGCNIPIFLSGLPQENIIAYKPKGCEWHNYFDEDDVLGWPLKPLSPSYKQVVDRDIQINAGSWLTSWNLASHMEYWSDRDLYQPFGNNLMNLKQGLPLE